MILKAQNILVLSDIQFLTTLSNHFQVIYMYIHAIFRSNHYVITSQAILGKDDAQMSLAESSVESSIMSGMYIYVEESL